LLGLYVFRIGMIPYYEELVDVENDFIALGSTPVYTMNNKGLEACLQKEPTKRLHYLGQGFVYCNVYSYAMQRSREGICVAW
jgi:hypothetical protein